MNLVTLLPLILIIGVMFLMTRSAKNKQRQAVEMRNQMEPGSGVRTIGGMYAEVKEVHEETVLLEVADGVHTHFAKNAVAAVLSREEFDRIVHGIESAPLDETETETEADASPAEDDEPVQADSEAEHIDLSKSEDEPKPKQDGTDSK